MSKLRKYAGLAALVAIVAALGISSAAFAQEARASVPAARLAHGGGFGFGFGRGVDRQAALDAAAKALGMTPDELSAQLWGGKTLAAIADEKGVDIQVVQDAVNAAIQDATKAAIEQAVTDGSMTRDKADWLLQGLDKGYWGASEGGFGMGFGMGRGGFHGRGGFGRFPAPNGNGSNGASPSTTPSGLSF